MQVEHGALGAVLQLLNVKGLAEEGQGHAVGAQGGLHDVGNVALVGLLVEVLKGFAAGFLMAAQVVVGPVGDAPELAPAEGEQVLDVGGGLGVERQFLLLVVPEPHVFFLHAQGEEPVLAVVLPVVEPVQVGVGLAEELALHLLELPGAEGEVAGGDLIAEGFADLADAEGQLLPGGALDGGEVHKDALSGLGAEVDLTLGVLGDADEGLEHEVELPDVGEVLAAAFGAGDAVVLDVGAHLLKGHAVGVAAVFLDELVGAVAGLAVLAVHQRVGEAAHVAGGDPGLGIHDDGGVQAHVVGGLLDEFLPPGLFHVVLELHAQGAVVPGVGQAAVDFAARVYKASALAEGDDLVHGFFFVFQHRRSFFRRPFDGRNFPYNLILMKKRGKVKGFGQFSWPGGGFPTLPGRKSMLYWT